MMIVYRVYFILLRGYFFWGVFSFYHPISILTEVVCYCTVSISDTIVIRYISYIYKGILYVYA